MPNPTACDRICIDGGGYRYEHRRARRSVWRSRTKKFHQGVEGRFL
jgi:iron only hydrogenase large subunit-like protein